MGLSEEAIRQACRKAAIDVLSSAVPDPSLERDGQVIIFGGDNPRGILVYGLVVLAILAFSYFVIIKPITDTTNKTVNDALRQSQQAINQGFKQSRQALNQAGRQSQQAQANLALQKARRALRQAKRQAQQAQRTP
jgi:hypothetical protein